MNQSEYAESRQKLGLFESLQSQLEKIETAIEDLKVTEGTLKMAIGGGRSHFQWFESHELQEFRERLIDLFRSRRDNLKRQIAEI